MIVKEVVELAARVKKELGITNPKEALDVAIKLQHNRMLRDLTDYLKNKL